ncbi:MAG TPA: hypothetical protein VMR39_13400 [Sphingobium sp.]|nr:hypothetical protein [Sphingobium sp.]
MPVEDVDRHAHKIVGLDRQKMLDLLDKQLGRFVGISDREAARVDRHDGDRHVVDHAEQAPLLIPFFQLDLPLDALGKISTEPAGIIDRYADRNKENDGQPQSAGGRAAHDEGNNPDRNVCSRKGDRGGKNGRLNQRPAPHCADDHHQHESPGIAVTVQHDPCRTDRHRRCDQPGRHHQTLFSRK